MHKESNDNPVQAARSDSRYDHPPRMCRYFAPPGDSVPVKKKVTVTTSSGEKVVLSRREYKRLRMLQKEKNRKQRAGL